MYLDFFKFRKKPFHITPDPDFLFLGPSHNVVLSSISHAIEQRRGLVVVTGEVGVGKTTILRSYLEGTDPARIRVVYIFNAALSFGRLMQQIVSELDIPAVDKDLPDYIDSVLLYLHDEYKNDRRVVLIIDEAQNLPVETLEGFQMLLSRETSQEKLLQVILVGQPEFESKVNLPELRDLKQRIASSCRIDTLKPDESHAYIQHRLMKVSSFHNPVFTKGALKRIVKEARGIPRIINVMCDNALITAFGYQRNPVDDKIIKEVIKDLRGMRPQTFFRREFVLYPVLVGFWGLVVLASMALFMPKEIPHRRTEIFTAKTPALPPAAETVKKPADAPPVKVALKVEPEPSIPEVQATGSDKSVSKIIPPAPVQRQTPGKTQASAAEKAPVPNDGGAPAKGAAAGGPKLQSHRYMVQLGSFVDKEEAEEIRARLKGNGYNAVVKTRKHLVLGEVFVIQLQPVGSASRATKLRAQLRGESVGEPVVIKVPSR